MISQSRKARIFLDNPESIDGGIIIFRGLIVRRLSRVLRLRRGDLLEVIYNDQLYEVRLIRIQQDLAEAEIVYSRAIVLNSPPYVTLCPSVIRLQRFEMVIEKATELGVERIRPVRAIRSLAKNQSGERLARWRRIVTEASEQCRREKRPAIEEPMDFGTLITEGSKANTVRIMASAWERNRRVVDVLERDSSVQNVIILVGPEGGFTPAETEEARSHDWIPVTLGPKPLRAETAGLVAVAIVQEALLRGSYLSH